MGYQPQTPFRRAYDAARLQDIKPAPQVSTERSVNKWDVLRELGVARKQFGLSDRCLTVLQALLGFHGSNDLSLIDAAPIVYPANATICARLNGMPCSTMRRHLSALVNAGLLIRRDSPNGKRFKREHSGQSQAFGFDLSPLLIRFDEIKDLADQVRNQDAHIKQLRLNASLMRRDLAALSELARIERPDLDIWDAYADLASLTARTLRRTLTADDLEQLTQKIANALADLQTTIDQVFPQEMSSTDAQNEQHHQNSIKEIEVKKEVPVRLADDPVIEGEASQRPTVSIRLVSAVCLELKSFVSEPLRSWSDLIEAADRIRPMMGVSNSVWQSAISAMGIEQASVVLAAMLERFPEIRSSNGYLRYLSAKANAGTFICSPMILALARRKEPVGSQL